jgi:4-amino-4-deoxychorismate lyase
MDTGDREMGISSLVNGRLCAELSVADRGLQYGDGVFETIAVKDGLPQQWERHLRRLRRGCKRLGIKPPASKLLLKEVVSLCGQLGRAVAKIIVTRGQSGRGYRPPVAAEPTRIVVAYPWPRYPEGVYDDGIKVRVCKMRLSCNPVLAGIKHLNRLEQVLARGEWEDEYQEGLMLDSRNRVIEGTMSNVFVIKDDALHTPKLDQCGVEGVMRQRLLELAHQQNIPAAVTELALVDLKRADGVLFCNSLIGVWPVQELGGQSYKIPPLTRRIMDEFAGEFPYL